MRRVAGAVRGDTQRPIAKHRRGDGRHVGAIDAAAERDDHRAEALQDLAEALFLPVEALAAFRRPDVCC
jgi:hypothetical protein